MTEKVEKDEEEEVKSKPTAMPPEFGDVILILNDELPSYMIRQVFRTLYPKKALLAERIRRCLICNSCFWAIREESAACSLGCANLVRVRRHRGKLD